KASKTRWMLRWCEGLSRLRRPLRTIQCPTYHATMLPMTLPTVPHKPMNHHGVPEREAKIDAESVKLSAGAGGKIYSTNEPSVTSPKMSASGSSVSRLMRSLMSIAAYRGPRGAAQRVPDERADRIVKVRTCGH